MGNQLDHCKKPDNTVESELQVHLVEAQRLEKLNIELKNKNQALQNENRELQTLTQELMDSREEAPMNAGAAQAWEIQVAEAQAQANYAAEENQRLLARVAELEERGQEQAMQLESTAVELEEARRRGADSPGSDLPSREMVAMQAERRAWLAEKAELEERLSEGRAELNRTEELAQRLQEEREEAMVKLAQLQASTAPSRDESLESTAHLLKGEERQRLKEEWEAQIGGNQVEIARLRAENQTLGAQCASLAEMAEQACARAEQARVRFEEAELAARGTRLKTSEAATVVVATAAMPNLMDGTQQPGLACHPADLAEVRQRLTNHLPVPAGVETPSQAGSERVLSMAASTVDAGVPGGYCETEAPKPKQRPRSLDATCPVPPMVSTAVPKAMQAPKVMQDPVLGSSHRSVLGGSHHSVASAALGSSHGHGQLGTGLLLVGGGGPAGTGQLPLGTGQLPLGTGQLPLGTGQLPLGTAVLAEAPQLPASPTGSRLRMQSPSGMPVQAHVLKAPVPGQGPHSPEHSRLAGAPAPMGVATTAVAMPRATQASMQNTAEPVAMGAPLPPTLCRSPSHGVQGPPPMQSQSRIVNMPGPNVPLTTAMSSMVW